MNQLQSDSLYFLLKVLTESDKKNKHFATLYTTKI